MYKKEFDEKGFLSNYFFTHRDEVLVTYLSEFSECGVISARAQNLIVNTAVSRSDPSLACAFLFAERTVRTCQAAIRLCEIGLVQEAQVLARTALETLFHSSALLSKPEVFESIQSNDDKEGNKFAASILKDLPADQVSPEDEKYLLDMVGRSAGNTFSLYDSAKIAGLLDLYTLQYRFLSALAGHATLRSLDRSFAPDNSEYEFYMGPTTNQLELTLGIISNCLDITVRNLKKVGEMTRLNSK